MPRREVTIVREQLSLPNAARPHSWPRRRGLRVLTLLAALGAATLVEAQPPYRQEVLPGLAGLDAGHLSSPAFADLDGDGDYDLVAGGLEFGHVYYATAENTHISYFFNVGDASTPVFAGATSSINPFSQFSFQLFCRPALADLDADGDFDLVVGRRQFEMPYFSNTGSSTNPAFLMTSSTLPVFFGFQYMTPTFADLDGDGDLDALVGERGGTVGYLRNTGNAMVLALAGVPATANPVSGIDVGFWSTPALGDLDGDLDLDLVVGNHYFRNTGSATAPAFTELTGSANPFEGLGTGWAPSLLDLDDDGDLDAVFGEGGGGFRYLLNTGSSTQPAFVVMTSTTNPFTGFFNAGQYSRPAIADLDGDGQLDVVVGLGSGRLAYLINTGSSTAPIFTQVTGTASPFFDIGLEPHVAPSLGDLDGDGDLDAVVGNNYGTVSTLINFGSSTAPVFAEVTGSQNPLAGVNLHYFTAPTLVDLDTDGDLDAVIGVDINFYGPGYLALYKNLGSATAPSFFRVDGTEDPFTGPGFGTVSTPAFADFDGDGDLDLVAGNYDGFLTYFLNSGSPSLPAFTRLTGSASPLAVLSIGRFSAPAIADLDGDGDLDVLSGQNSGTLSFFRSLAPIFVDGFESGDTSAWSLTVP